MSLRAAACALLVTASFASAQVQTGQGNGAVLRALDKLSGKVVDISMQAGSAARFEELEIVLTECRYPDGNPSGDAYAGCLLYTSPSPRDQRGSRMPSSA